MAVYATVALFMLLVAASIALLVGVWLVSSFSHRFQHISLNFDLATNRGCSSQIFAGDVIVTHVFQFYCTLVDVMFSVVYGVLMLSNIVVGVVVVVDGRLVFVFCLQSIPSLFAPWLFVVSITWLEASCVILWLVIDRLKRNQVVQLDALLCDVTCCDVVVARVAGGGDLGSSCGVLSSC